MAKHNIVITERDQKILELLKKFGYIREDLLANITLDFDTIAKKLTAELTKLNSAHEADGK